MPEQDRRSQDSEFELDRLIDSALGTYAEPAANGQLAQRVLARVAERAHRRGPMWLPWAIALPVAAGLLLLLVLSGSKPAQHPVDRANQAVPSPPLSNHIDASESPSTPHPVPAKRVTASRPRRAETATQSKPLPKLDVFPTPQPLTPAEKTLESYTAHASEAERKALVEAQKRMDAPLSIAAIDIQPLEPPEKGGN